MNPPIDTNKDRATPSVWPVYVAAGVIVVMSFVGISMLVGYGHLMAVFGFVTGWGILRLRPWAWWCAVVWVVVFPFLCGLLSARDAYWAPGGGVAATATLIMIMLSYTLGGAVGMVLVIWPLVTRRRLFFPPKQEGEE